MLNMQCFYGGPSRNVGRESTRAAEKNHPVLPCRRNEIGCISWAPFIDFGQQDSRRLLGESKAQSNDRWQRERDGATSEVK